MVHGTTQRVPLIGNARNEDVSSVIDRRSEYYRKKARTRSLEEEVCCQAACSLRDCYLVML